MQWGLKWAAVCTAAVGMAVAGASQAAIIYSVDQTVGLGSVVGTIETDGATGVLAPSDIVGWNLTVSGPGASITIDTSDSSVLFGNSYNVMDPTAGNGDVSADARHLYFNFDGTDKGYLAFQQSGYSGNGYWCNATANETYECVAGKSVVPQHYTDPSAQFDTTASGNQVIGVAGVPEPATWGLMLLGVGGVGAMARTRRRPTLAAI